MPQKTVATGLARWRTLQGIGKKPNTLLYHEELEGIIRAKWVNLETPVDEVTDEECVVFATSIAHYAVSRYNGVVNAIRKIIPAAKCIPRRKQLSPEKHIPTKDEFTRLLVALDTASRGHAALVVRFLAHTGIRINEARQLKWTHIREDHVFLPADITKNSHPRTIPFVEGTAEVIRALRRVRLQTKKRKEFVLPQVECKRALGYACKLASVAHCSHHTFRHYFTTQCIQSGVDIPTVAAWLGHLDNGALLLRWYCHLMNDHSLEMAKKVKVGGLPVEMLKAKNVVILERVA